MQEYLTGEKTLFSAKGEVDTEFDFTLPEYLPNISRIIKTDITAEKSTFSAENVPHLTVSLKIEVLYVSDFAGKIKNATFHETADVPFDAKADITEDFTETHDINITKESSKPITSRKVHTSFSLFASVEIHKKEQKEVFCSSDEESIHTLCDTVEVCTKETLSEQLFEIEKELTVDGEKPSVGDIIQARAVFGTSKCTCGEKTVEFEASLTVHVLYETTPIEENGGEVSYETISLPIAVKESIPIESATADAVCLMKGNVKSTEASVTFDPYGESRTVSVSVKYALCGVLYTKKSTPICLDAFCESCESDIKFCNESIECVREVISDTVHLDENIRADIHDIFEISDCICTLLSTSFELSEGKFFASARCAFKILGTTSSGDPLSLDTASTLKIPLSSSAEHSDCVPEAVIGIEKCLAKIKEGELYLDFDIDVFAIFLSKRNLTFISSVEKKSAEENSKKESEIIIYYPTVEDSVWSISKKYRVNPEKLKATNGIDSEKEPLKHCVLIP